jgi:predicted HicB family RNase H-like nuclease
MYTPQEVDLWHHGSMPNQPKTPHKSFRIPPELYSAAQAKAARQGRTLTDVVKELLQNYVDSAD